MCGIAGLIGGEADAGLRRRMLARIAHRGPDDHGEAQVDGALLLHTRLAILDLTCAGHQPMADVPAEGSANTIVFNGEVYNFEAMHAPLAAAGWPCRTRSDTEVLLHAYRVWGEDFLARLRGMWAFCLVDRERGIAHIARDRFGIKPLYLYRPAGGGLAFASEMRALLSATDGLATPTIDPAALEGFLAQGAVQGFDALVQGITLLPPATILTVDLRTGAALRSKRYWELPRQQATGDRATSVVELAAVAREAVRLHLVSDVPVGLFLSGGVDSAALLALATEQQGAVRTLNVGFDVPAFDESAPAAAMAKHFGASHTAVSLTGADVLARLPDALAAMDQPTIDGINVFVVSQATREAGLTVALSGLGSDELFGGYSTFRDIRRAVAMRRWLPLSRFSPLIERVRANRTGMKAAELFRRPPDPLSMYLLRRELFMPAERRTLHTLPQRSDRASGLPIHLLADAREAALGTDAETMISSFELGLYMRHMLLRDGDVFSMAAPIEYRVPFLDHHLAEAVYRLPGAWKRPDPRPKPLLLDLVGRGRIPSAAWTAPKRGFSFPWNAWFRPGGPLQSLGREALLDAPLWTRLGMRPSAAQAIWRRFEAGDQRIAGTQILAFVTLRAFALHHGLQAA